MASVVVHVNLCDGTFAGALQQLQLDNVRFATGDSVRIWLGCLP